MPYSKMLGCAIAVTLLCAPVCKAQQAVNVEEYLTAGKLADAHKSLLACSVSTEPQFGACSVARPVLR